jgi:hypothetical protein
MRDFFLYARTRQEIFYSRQQGNPWPWTNDPVLRDNRFCNVYREDDTTTKWFAKWVRDPLRDRTEVLLATVLFRWFNRISTGDAIFRQLGDYTPDGRGLIRTAWDQFLHDSRTPSLRVAVRQHCGSGPYVTGAYIIKTPDGMSKLDGVLQCVEWFRTQKHNCSLTLEDGMTGHTTANWDWFSTWMLLQRGRVSLEQTWDWLRKFPYLGDFMAYEIVTDLRHTALLDYAPDIYTWANPGPGAMRGLNRLHERKLEHRQPKHVFVCEMRKLLDLANGEFRHVWPHRMGHDVEMRDIEHTLCEFDKYVRAKEGGRMKQRYRYAG